MRPGNVSRIQHLAIRHGIAADVLGETISGRLEICVDEQLVASAEVSDLNQTYESALESSLQTYRELAAGD